MTRRILLPIVLILAACSPQASSPEGYYKAFDAQRAWGHIEHFVALGPRPPASEALDASRDYMRAQLEPHGWEVREQVFTAPTPFGPTRFANLLAQMPGSKPEYILATHIDTKIYEDIVFVGANDGASSTAVVIEMGRVLAEQAPALARKCLLVFFDGEECFVEYSATDGLYGSRHFAEKLLEEDRSNQFRHGILLDMVGDSNLGITFPSDSPPDLVRTFFKSAQELGLRDRFSLSTHSVLDDHVPLNKAGIPTINVIDFDYPPWHTEGDTIDKLSPESLRIVGSTTLKALQLLEKPSE